MIAIVVACVGLTVSVGPACLVDLERHIACGDGHVDKKAGEQCDPQAPTIEGAQACIEEFGSSSKPNCNPITCQIGCCGDHKVDIGEQCDGPIVPEECPGEGVLRCNEDCTIDRRECERCGNGSIDKSEECDPNKDISSTNETDNDESNIIECSDLSVVGSPATNGEIKTMYFSGKVHRSACDPQTCKYRRNGCSFCGDGIRDDQFTDYLYQIIYPKEQCDHDDMLPSTVHQYCLDRCAKNDESSFIAGDLRCLYTCNDSCRLSPPEGQGDQCCIKPDRPCGPSVDKSVRNMPCCSSLGSEDSLHPIRGSCVKVPDTRHYVCAEPPGLAL